MCLTAKITPLKGAPSNIRAQNCFRRPISLWSGLNTGTAENAPIIVRVIRKRVGLKEMIDMA